MYSELKNCNGFLFSLNNCFWYQLYLCFKLPLCILSLKFAVGFCLVKNTVSDIKYMLQTPFMYSELKNCNGFLFSLNNCFWYQLYLCFKLPLCILSLKFAVGFCLVKNTVSDIKYILQTPFMYSKLKICNRFLFGLNTVSDIKCIYDSNSLHSFMYSESQISLNLPKHLRNSVKMKVNTLFR